MNDVASGLRPSRSVSSPSAAVRVVTLRDVIAEAFVAGFICSSEGYNGEYPFYGCERSIRRELWEQIQDAREKITTSLLAEMLEADPLDRSGSDAGAEPPQPHLPHNGE
jgi:hypothetical protein